MNDELSVISWRSTRGTGKSLSNGTISVLTNKRNCYIGYEKSVARRYALRFQILPYKVGSYMKESTGPHCVTQFRRHVRCQGKSTQYKYRNWGLSSLKVSLRSYMSGSECGPYVRAPCIIRTVLRSRRKLFVPRRRAQHNPSGSTSRYVQSQNCHCRVHQSESLFPVVSQMNPLRFLTHCQHLCTLQSKFYPCKSVPKDLLPSGFPTRMNAAWIQ